MRLLTHAAGTTIFLVLATLNSGGYRYGASDQAFYIPAILRQLDPSLFPFDRDLIGPQARYFFVDELVAGLVARTGWSIEAWFAIGYVVPRRPYRATRHSRAVMRGFLDWLGGTEAAKLFRQRGMMLVADGPPAPPPPPPEMAPPEDAIPVEEPPPGAVEIPAPAG